MAEKEYSADESLVKRMLGRCNDRQSLLPAPEQELKEKADFISKDVIAYLACLSYRARFQNIGNLVVSMDGPTVVDDKEIAYFAREMVNYFGLPATEEGLPRDEGVANLVRELYKDMAEHLKDNTLGRSWGTVTCDDEKIQINGIPLS